MAVGGIPGLICSAETNVTVSLDPSDNLVSTDVLARLSEDLAQVCRVKVIAPCAAITLVGLGMRSLLHKLSDVWATFGRERVHLISQSSNDLNLTFVIDEADADGLLPVLHAELIDSGAMPVYETAVFGPRWKDIIGTARARPLPWWLGERERLLALAGEGTPRYVYHLPTVRERARQLLAVEAVDRRYYAIKANSHPAILRTLADEGFGLECVSLAEVGHVLDSVPGFDPGRVLFTPSFAPIDEYAQAFALGVTVTVDNCELLARWPEVFRGRSLWLRIDLGRGDGHHEKVTTGGKASKFGLAAGRVEEFADLARSLDAPIVGLHAHLGSGVETREHWRQMVDELAGFARRIGTVEVLDIGGGLPIPYAADDEPFDLEAWGAGLAEVKAIHPAWQLTIEPGRFLVAWHPKSSPENERTPTVVRMPSGQKVLFRQIAGLIARRIISYMTVGHQVEQNSVCGFIKFGSRVDVLVPKDSELLVEIGDPTVGSQTPIARLRKNLENE